MSIRFVVLFSLCISISMAAAVPRQQAAGRDDVQFVSHDTLAGLNAKLSSWQGFTRYHFAFKGYDCFITAPHQPLPSRPWVWRAKFPGYHDEIDVILVEKGFHVAHINLGAMLGSPKARNLWDEFYEYVTETAQLSPVVALEAVSRGGLYAYNWAANNPEKVACIYADTPVLDFKSWPGGKGKGMGSPADWQNLLNQYGITEAEALVSKDIPLEKLEILAKANIPILHVVSTNDTVVPPEENTLILEKKYRALGGRVTVLANQNGTEKSHGHHFPLDDPKRCANFILENTPLPPLADGLQWYQLRGDLKNSFIKFSREKTGRVAFMGGSITQMSGWREMAARYLQERFPDTTFDFVYAGIASTGSTPGAFRLEHDVLSKGTVDLFFEEAAVNDLHNGRSPVEQIRAMEGIVRHARTVNPKMDFIQMHFAEPRHTTDYSNGKTPEVIANHEKVAAHYGNPSINLAEEVHDRMKAGQFKWDNDFVNLHPSPFGQRLYYWSIKRLLDKAYSGVLNEDEAMTDHPLPNKLDPQCYSKGKFADIACAVAVKGFRIDPKCRPKNGGTFRDSFVDVPMLVGDRPGDSFGYAFSGRGIGLFVIAGPDAGIIEYTLDNEPKRQIDLFTPWSGRLNIPWAYMLDADLKPGDHRLQLTLSDKKNTNSKGHALRIRNILVNE